MQKVWGENKKVKRLLKIDKTMNVGKPEVNNYKVKEISHFNQYSYISSNNIGTK